MGKVFDRYFLVARVLVGVIVAMPLVVAVLLISPSGLPIAVDDDIGSQVKALPVRSAAAAAVLMLLAYVAWGAGKRLEPRLWRQWGGSPTTKTALWLDATHTVQWKARLHASVRRLTGMDLLSAEDERNQPAEARRLVADACGILRNKTRGLPEASLLRSINIEYGFARNLLGARWLWMAGSALAVAISLGGCWADNTVAANASLVICAVSLLASQVLGFWWLPTHTKQIADRYAEEFWAVVMNMDGKFAGKEA